MGEIKKYDGGMKIFGVPIGMGKHLFDRYRNYLSWFQLPLLMYTAFMTTVNYYPALFAGHVLEYAVLGAIGFILFSIVSIYLDWKYVFPSERNFLYEGTPFFIEEFAALHKEIDNLKDI